METGSEIEDQEEVSWLNAKACGRGTRIDERLRSRGLVKRIQVCGPDAIDVQAAIMTAFGDVPDLLVEDPYTQHEDNEKNSIPKSLTKYLGLQASWIPLRKLHKNSSLRFLSTSEMVTPTLWTVQFLSTSVAMKTSGLRRLYVTHRDSYIQQHGDTSDWTWHKLRQLPRVYPDQTSQSGSSHIPEGDAEEPCWEFDERLDPPPMDVNMSFESQVSSLSIRSLRYEEPPVSQSDHFSSAPLSPTATSPTSVPPPSRRVEPLIERHPFRPVHIRTTSMPSIVPLKSPPQPSKRRHGSSEQELSSSPSRATSTSTTNLALKRRRISRSPSRAGNTPRWSVGPPSPYIVMDETTSKRATTPFAYATPHSNAPYVDTRPKDGAEIEIFEDSEEEEDFGSATNELYDEESGVEQKALSDYDGSSDSEGQGQRDDEEWQGVDDAVGEDGRSFGLGLVERVVAVDDEDEDEDAMSEGSEGSSTPSEYPSTQPKIFALERARAGFEIHVDDEGEED